MFRRFIALAAGDDTPRGGSERFSLLHSARCMFASSDEDDIKEIIESEGEYYFADLQFGQKRDLSKYEPLTEETFYKLLYGWLRA